MKSSIDWINTLKVCCMILIYLNHSETYCNVSTGKIQNIYGPLFVSSFFFISGYLFFMKQLKEPLIQLNSNKWLNCRLGGGKYLLLNILYKIALPSILFSSFIYLPKKILRGQTFEWSGFLIETVGGCTYWFTSALVIAELILVFLLWTRVKSIWFYVGIGVLIAFVGYVAFNSHILWLSNPNFPWFWKSSLGALFYMTLGGLYWRYEKIIDKTLQIDKWWIIILIAISYSSYCIFDFRAYNGIGGLNSSPVTIGSALLSMAGIIFIISICKKVPTTSFFDFWGRNTIGLYFMSGAIPNTVAIIMGKVMPGGAIMLIACWLLSFSISLLVVFFLNRKLPCLFDLRKYDNNQITDKK